MQNFIQKILEDKLREYQVPYLNQSLLALKAIHHVSIEQCLIKIEIKLGFPIASVKDRMVSELNDLLTPLLDANQQLTISVISRIEPHAGNLGIKALPNVKNMIAVGSGKGGVGKSTIAVNLALALAKEGANVGLLDADIYGPSQPAMLGTRNQKPALENKTLKPIRSHNIQTMSIGYLIDQNAAMVWRGPMLGKAMQQLIYDTAWQDLDYLVIDLPPGTGDVQLTMCQKIPLSGALLVTTPQELAILDVRRACAMFRKLNVPMLGIVENMSGYRCANCGHQETIFGEGGGLGLAKEYELSLLGEVPLDPSIRIATDSGIPPVAATNENPYASLFCEIARKTSAKLALLTKDYSARFPKIVREG